MSVINNAVNDAEITIIDVSEPLTSKTARMFEQEIDRFIVNGRNKIVLNAGTVQYVSSDGIGALVYATRSSSLAGGVFVACFNSSEVIALLKAVGIYDSLHIVQSVEQGKNFIRNNGVIPVERKPESRLSMHEANRPETVRYADADGQKNTQENGSPFDHPLIIECSNCSNFTRVHRAGDYICPACHAEFSVREDGTVVF